MLFAEIRSEVISITKRPDKAADIDREINKTLRKMSFSTDLAQDLYEGEIALEFPTELVNGLALSDFPRFRKFAYLKPPSYKKPLKLITPETAFRDCVEELDSYYVAGTNAVIRLSIASSSLRYGYYQLPEKQTDTTASPHWLLSAADYCLVDGVAAALFRSLGDERSAGQYEADFRLQWDAIRADLKYGGSA